MSADAFDLILMTIAFFALLFGGAAGVDDVGHDLYICARVLTSSENWCWCFGSNIVIFFRFYNIYAVAALAAYAVSYMTCVAGGVYAVVSHWFFLYVLMAVE